MNRLARLAMTAAAGILLVVALAVMAGSRPAPPGAAPGGSVAPDPTAPPRPVVESAVPGPTVAVSAATSETPARTTPPDNIPDLPLAPAVPAEPPNSECHTVLSIVDRAMPMNMADEFHIADRAVLATVVEIGPAQWNTPDGKAPPGDWREAAPSDVMRLVRFWVDEVWKGDLDGSFVASIQGGDIGCWTFKPDPDEFPEVAAGKQFALFFRGSPKRAGLEQAHKVLTILPLDEKGRIVTPEEGHLTPAEMADRARSSTGE